MKTTHSLLAAALLLASFTAGHALAEPLAAASTIQAATVYPDRAVVTREAKVSVPAGESEILFKDLPQGMMEDSLQVTGAGIKATLLDVTAKTLTLRESPNERIREAEKKIKEAEKKIHDLRRDIRIHEEAKQGLARQQALVGRIEDNYLAAPATGKDGAVAPRPTVADYQNILKFSDESSAAIQEKVRGHDDAIEGLNDGIREVERGIADLRGQCQATTTQSRAVSVRVDAPQAGELVLRLSYATAGASWTPSYDVRLSKERTASITYFGNVRQNTGEDWNNAQLTLSTAKPDLGGTAPELREWTLDVARPAQVGYAYGGRSMTMTKSESFRPNAAAQAEALEKFGKEAAAAAPAPAPTALAMAQVVSDGTVASFRIERPTSIPSNNQSFRVSITSLDLNGKLQYQAVPALSETAFLSGYFKLTGEYPFLAGPANFFLGDTFISSSRLPTTMPGAVLTASFGADEGISLKRRLANRLTEDTGFTNSGTRVTYEYEFTVQNNKATRERVVFRDHLPVSRNEKIEVALLAPSPSSCGKKPLTVAEALALTKETTLEDNGEICWRLDLKPGEKRVIPFKFTVDSPKNVPVSGL